jgi:hypothetical protein
MGEYEPHDSRKAKQQPGEEGKRPGWRQAEAGEAKEPYEPFDSRRVTQGQEQAAGEPGEGSWRQQEAADTALGQTELEGDERGEEAEQVPDPQAEQALNDSGRDAAMQQDEDELDDEAPGDRND